MTGQASSSGRKADHLDLCATGDVGFRTTTTLFENVRFVHDALPELALDQIDLRTDLLGKPLRAPLVIASMTGGTPEAERVNRELSAIAERRGYAFALGSQRSMLRARRSGKAGGAGALASTFRVRDVAPTTLILSNLGGVQAAASTSAEVAALVAEVGADAVCVHLNPAMELVQPEGDRDFRGVLDAIARLVRDLGVPVVAKETGCGIGPAAAAKLRSVGVAHVDVSGAGGTSWVGVETKRAEIRNAGGGTVSSEAKRALGESLWDWGIPTAVATVACASANFSTIVATGGVATGRDVAASIALGASAAGIARPLLQALYAGGPAAVDALFDAIEFELRATMLLVGARDLAALRRAPRIVGGELAVWLRALHLSPDG